MTEKPKQLMRIPTRPVSTGGDLETFIEKNQNLISGIILAIFLLVGGWYVYKNYYKEPLEKEAAEQMWQAQFQFEQDSFNLALNNPGGGYDGFLGIIENYPGTRAANLSKYYAGVSYLRLGNYDKALEYLEDYDPHTPVMKTMKYGVMGDVLSEQDQLEQASKYYKKAYEAAWDHSDFLAAYYLLKYGELQEELGNKEEAHRAYTEIKKYFPKTPDARQIDLFIGRVE